MRFETKENEGTYGILSGDVIEAVDCSPFSGVIPSRSGQRVPLAEARLLPPVGACSIFAPAQPNYGAHLKTHAHTYGSAPALDFNYRGTNSLVGHGSPIVLPCDATEQVVFEGELAVVIGRQARQVAEEDAAAYIFGYTIANDVSDRGWQASDRTVWRAKNADTFCPIGPWIETDFDLGPAVTTVTLNGDNVACFATGDLIVSVPSLVARLSRYVTLNAGDVILCGADEPTLPIAPNDIVEVSITGLGTLSNPVTRAV